MAHTPDDLVGAIKQMREYAAAYQGARKEFFDGLYEILATPVSEKDHEKNIKMIYLAAVNALTSEICPPTAETYAEVVKKLNSSLKDKKLGVINIAVYPDEGMDDGVQIIGEARAQDLPRPALQALKSTLPLKVTLTKKQQTLVDKFRAEIPSLDRPFKREGQQRG